MIMTMTTMTMRIGVSLIQLLIPMITSSSTALTSTVSSAISPPRTPDLPPPPPLPLPRCWNLPISIRFRRSRSRPLSSPRIPIQIPSCSAPSAKRISPSENPLRGYRAVTSTIPIASSLGYRITTRARSVDSSSPLRRRKRKPSVVVARTRGSGCPIWLRSWTETRRKTIGSESETRWDGSLGAMSRWDWVWGRWSGVLLGRFRVWRMRWEGKGIEEGRWKQRDGACEQFLNQIKRVCSSSSFFDKSLVYFTDSAF